MGLYFTGLQVIPESMPFLPSAIPVAECAPKADVSKCGGSILLPPLIITKTKLARILHEKSEEIHLNPDKSILPASLLTSTFGYKLYPILYSGKKQPFVCASLF